MGFSYKINQINILDKPQKIINNNEIEFFTDSKKNTNCNQIIQFYTSKERNENMRKTINDLMMEKEDFLSSKLSKNVF